MRSRLKYKNELLQEVEVLRDENELLRDTMEVLTHELEKRRVNTAACDFPEKNCLEVQPNPHSQLNLLSPPSRVKNVEWNNHLNLVQQITSSKSACDSNSIHHHDPVQDCNQPQPIPTRITHRKPPKNLKNREHRKTSKNKQAPISDKFFRLRPTYHQIDWYNYYY